MVLLMGSSPAFTFWVKDRSRMFSKAPPTVKLGLNLCSKVVPTNVLVWKLNNELFSKLTRMGTPLDNRASFKMRTWPKA